MLSPKTDPDRLSQLLQLAAQLSEKGRTEEAIHLYRAVLKLSPRNVSVWHQLAKLYELQGKTSETIESYQSAIAIEPNQPFWVYRHLGFAFSQQGQLEKAIVAYQQAISIQPQDDATYSLLGKAQQTMGNLAGAAKSYQQAIALNPQQPIGVYIALGDAFSKQGDIDGAIAIYETAWEIEPENGSLQRLLADTYAQKVLDVDGHLKLAQQLQKQGEWDEAIHHYQAILAIETDNIAIWHQVAKLYESQGKFAEASHSYQRAISIDPEQPFWVYRHLGFALMQQGQLDAAIAAYHQAIAASPDESTYNLLGQAHQKLGNFADAIDNYHKAIALNPQQPSGIYIALGEALSQQAQTGISSKERSIELAPTSPFLPSLTFPVRSDSRIDGYLDLIDGCRLCGWAWDTLNPDESLTLIIYKEREEVARVVANRYRDDLKKQGIGTGNYGFWVRLPFEVCKQSPFNLEIGVEDRDFILKNSQVQFVYQAIDTSNLKGVCEPSLKNGQLKGWVINEENPFQKVDIYIYDGNNFLLSVPANEYRKDLHELFKGDGKFGYSIELPESLLDNKFHELHFCFGNSAESLKNSPIAIEENMALQIVIQSARNSLSKCVKISDELSKIAKIH